MKHVIKRLSHMALELLHKMGIPVTVVCEVMCPSLILLPATSIILFILLYAT